jgi:hypothetical protein
MVAVTSTPFILFAQPRTGSTFVIDELSSHPDIVCYGALFGGNERLWNRSHSNSLVGRLRESLGPEWGSLQYRISNWRLLLEHLPKVPRRVPPELRRAGVKVSSVNVVGVKHMMRGQNPILEGAAKDESINVVVLVRENCLASYSSELIVRVTGQSHAREKPNVRKAKAVFDEHEFQRYVDRSTRLNGKYAKLLAGADKRALFVTYNEIRAAEGINKVVEFLGCTPVENRSVRFVKRNSDDILSRFENADEVRRYLDEIGKPEWVDESAGI